jgi:cytochrome c2
MRFKLLIFIPLFMILWSCSGGDDSSISSNMQRQIENEPHQGEKLIEKHCYLCHNQESQEDGRIGPPMTHVKRHYLDAYPEQSEFTKQLISFVQNPTEDHSIMPGALKKFGLMPKQQFPKEALDQIADYLFIHDLTKKQQSSVGGNSKDYAKLGLEFALSAKKVLGQNLMSAMQSEGPIHALEFCNLRAIPLTDSMSQVHNVSIQRVSDRNRNPLNKASEKETEYIRSFQQLITNGKDADPIVIADGNKSIFYYPIVTNDMCLKCHGNPEKSLSEKINNLYPDDLATGYSENEVRGIWKIVFNEGN